VARAVTACQIHINQLSQIIDAQKDIMWWSIWLCMTPYNGDALKVTTRDENISVGGNKKYLNILSQDKKTDLDSRKGNRLSFR
jgi:hypothetical protein